MTSKIERVVWDADDCLNDTERLNFAGAASLAADAISKRVSHPVTLKSEELRIRFVGMHFSFWFPLLAKDHFAVFSDDEVAALALLEIPAVVKQLQGLQARSDVCQTLRLVGEATGWPSKIVTASAVERARVIVEKTGLEHLVSGIISATTERITKQQAYELAAEQSGLPATLMGAVDDSKTGAQAALDAGYGCVVANGAFITADEWDAWEKTMRAIGCHYIASNWGLGPDGVADCLIRAGVPLILP